MYLISSQQKNDNPANHLKQSIYDCSNYPHVLTVRYGENPIMIIYFFLSTAFMVLNTNTNRIPIHYQYESTNIGISTIAVPLILLCKYIIVYHYWNSQYDSYFIIFPYDQYSYGYHKYIPVIPMILNLIAADFIIISSSYPITILWTSYYYNK